MDPNLVRAAGFEPAREQACHRLAGLFAGAAPASFRPAIALEHLPMSDRLASALADRHAVAGLRVPADRPVDGAAWPVGRAPDEGQIAAFERSAAAAVAGELRRQRAVRAIFFATTIRPVVSLSSRCTMPGRRSPPMPERISPQWAMSALTSVPVQFPAAGCTTRPLGLSITIMSASS